MAEAAQPRDDGNPGIVDETTQRLVRRFRIALLGSMGAIVVFALADLLLEANQLGLLYGVKVAAIALVVSSLLCLQWVRSQRAVILVALGSISALYVLSTISAIAGAEPLTTPLLSISVAIAAATLLPWGVWPQIALVCIASVATIVTVRGATGGYAMVVTYPNVGVGFGLGVSVFVAYEFERSRALLQRRLQERQRAESEVHRLNAALEARVADRTATLEAVNRDLQREVAMRRQTEAELRHSEAALNALVEYTNAAIWTVDRDYRITAHNTAVADLFERTFHQAIDVRSTGAPPDDWRALYDRALAGERFTIEREDVIDGERRVYLSSFAPILSDGEVSGLGVCSIDVTDRKRVEENARRHQAELTHVLRLHTMGEMAATLAHEINQPLGAIANYAHGAIQRLHGDNTDHRQLAAVIDLIAAEALRAGAIIRRLRGLVRKEDGRREWIDLHHIAAETLTLMEPEFRARQVVAHLEGEGEVPHVCADPIQIEQVVLNLVRNAIEAMASVPPDRRHLRVRVGAAPDGGAALTVEDQGPGIAETVASQVFEPFFSTKSDGLGMGLSISRTIIEAHRGRLWVTSRVGGGAAFHFRLPRGDDEGVCQSVSA